MYRPPSFLTSAIGAVAIYSVASCAAVQQGALPAGLADSLTGVTQLTTAIGAFANDLGPALDTAGLQKLGGYVNQAKDLGATVSGFQSQVSELAADPLSAISNKLGELGNFDVNKLVDLPGDAQVQQVKDLADSAGTLGKSVNDFLGSFGG